MANIIRNPNLTCTYSSVKEAYTVDNWYHDCIKVRPRSYNTGIIVTENDSEFSEGRVSPGIYQVLNLSSYTGKNYTGKTIRLNVELYAGYSTDYAKEDIEFYVYLYDLDGNQISYGGVEYGFENPIYKQKVLLEYDPDRELYKYFTFTIDFVPGQNEYYALGFGADGIIYNDTKHKVATESIVGLWLNNVSLEVSELDNVINIPHDDLIDKLEPSSYDVIRKTEEEDSIGTYFHRECTFAAAENYKYGLVSKFTIPELDIPNSEDNLSEYKAVFSFWYRSDLPEGKKLKVILYDAINKDNYWIEEILTTTNQWSFYSVYLDFIFAETYRLLIIPPIETYDSYVSDGTNCSKLYIKEPSFIIFLDNDVVETGTFDNPYLLENGSLVWDNGVCSYKFYNGKYPQENKFIRMKELITDNFYHYSITTDKYYMTKNTSGNIYMDGLYDFVDEEGIEYYRYFDSDGYMAIDKKFIHDNVYYIADENGKAVLESSVLSDLNLYIEGYDNTVKVIDILEGESLTLHAAFNKMYPAISLDIECDDNIISIASIDLNAQVDNYGGHKTSNTSNDITILGKRYGQSAITLSYTNFDGSIAKQSILVHVCDESEYSNDIYLEMPYEANYVGLEQALQLKCLVRPLMSYKIPIDWHSSDESIAKVDAFGNITPVSIGSCTITAINYKSKKTASCTLYVVEETDDPSYIILTPESVDLKINDMIQIKAKTYNAWTETYENVRQSFIWSSEDDSIAIVDEFGYVKGINNGSTRVMCKDAHSPYIEFASITVSGECIKIQGIELDIQETMFMAQDTSAYEYITPTFYPPETSQTEVIWLSDNEDVVMVDQNGKIYPNPNFNTPDEGNNIARIKCISVANSNIYATCEVAVVEPAKYVPAIYLSPKSIKTYQDQTAIAQCKIANSSYITDKVVTASVLRKDGTPTMNDITVYGGNQNYHYINLVCDEMGEFIVTVTCEYVNSKVSSTKKYTSATYEVIVLEHNFAPVIVKDLKVENVYYNGSYVLSYYAEDDINLYLKHTINLDGEDHTPNVETFLYNGENYYYIFGQNLKAGEHQVYITVADSSGASTSSELISFTIPVLDANKRILEHSKAMYDTHTIDIVTYLHTLINDENISLVEKKEFDARYGIWNYSYENFRTVLNLCVEHIKDQIEASQAQMATIATALISDGTSVAAYSEGDYTNSNYQTVTDMDYYQNECIKELTNRVLQLEALVQQLMNNNN